MDNREVIRHYAQFWQNYQPFSRRRFQEERFIKRRARLFNFTGKVLNCGCGKGTWSIPLAQRCEVTNFDYSERALNLAKQAFKQRNLRGDFKQGNILNMPFADNSFDAVVSFGVLEHFDDIEKPIKEMVRVLKPEATFFAEVITKRFSVHSLERAINFLISFVFNLLRFRWDVIKKSVANFNSVYENSFPYQHYQEVAQACGLRDVRVEGIRPYPLIVLPSFLDRLFAKIPFPVKGPKRLSAIWSLTGVKSA